MLTSDTKQKHKKLLELPIIEEINSRLLNDWTLSATADYVQQQGYLVEVPKSSLMTTLGKYRADLPPDMVNDAKFKKAVALEKERLEQNISSPLLDNILELEKLYMLQVERISGGRTLEKNLKMLMPGMANEIKLAKDLIETHAEIQQKMGIMKVRSAPPVTLPEPPPPPEELQASKETQEVLDNEDSRKKVIELAQKLLISAQTKVDNDDSV